jgi:hypothetical protein
MKKYEVVVEDESAEILTELLKSLPYIKEVKPKEAVDFYTLASEDALSKDWLAEDDDELQKLYNK